MKKTLDIIIPEIGLKECNGMLDVRLYDGDRLVWKGTVAKLVDLVDTILSPVSDSLYIEPKR